MKTEKIEFEKTSFTFPKEILKKFRHRCLELDNMQQSHAIVKAIEVWLNTGYSADEQECIQQVLNTLRSGNAEQIKGIRALLSSVGQADEGETGGDIEAAADAVKRAAEAKKGSPRASGLDRSGVSRASKKRG